MEDIFAESNQSGLTVHLSTIRKSDLNAISNALISKVQNGEEDAIKVLVQAKGLEEIAKGIISGVKDLATEAATNYHKDDMKIMGVSFITKNLPNKYDFSYSESWSQMNERLCEIKAQMKEHESLMIKAIDHGGFITGDGVEIVPARILESGGETIQVTIPK